jgi:hypothetical protein
LALFSSIHFSIRKTSECHFFKGKPEKKESTKKEMLKGIRDREEKTSEVVKAQESIDS